MGRRASQLFTPAHAQPALPRPARRASGVYYTPPEVAKRLVGATLGPLLAAQAKSARPLQILDPACGAGGMLCEARRLAAAAGQAVGLLGTDIDPQAVALAAEIPGASVWQASALLDERLSAAGPFDAVVGNPPYVNIRQLAKTAAPADMARLRADFRTARGNFDLYGLFLELALRLLRPGGRCGMIVPNKWATLDYARPLRQLLLEETTIDEVIDLSSLRVFAGASVYPQIIVLTKGSPPPGHRVVAVPWQLPASRQRPSAAAATVRFCQRQLSADGIRLAPTIAVESRVATRPLGELCRLACGTAGYSARRIAALLADAPDAAAEGSVPFITSGNIDRYALRLGNVRFLGRKYESPHLPLAATGVTERQRRLFAGPKIVIAGLSQRLEAAWDDQGLALGVQVFAATQCAVDPQYLLAILNSKLLTYLFRTRFAAKRLAHGYMAINKGQLAQLPIAVGETSRPPRGPDDRIDDFVYRLYRLTKAEIATVEAHLAGLGRRAA